MICGIAASQWGGRGETAARRGLGVGQNDGGIILDGTGTVGKGGRHEQKQEQEQGDRERSRLKQISVTYPRR
jgi:hypothetical protein